MYEIADHASFAATVKSNLRRAIVGVVLTLTLLGLAPATAQAATPQTGCAIPSYPYNPPYAYGWCEINREVDTALRGRRPRREKVCRGSSYRRRR